MVEFCQLCWGAKAENRLYWFHPRNSCFVISWWVLYIFLSTKRKEKYFRTTYLHIGNFKFEWLLILLYTSGFDVSGSQSQTTAQFSLRCILKRQVLNFYIKDTFVFSLFLMHFGVASFGPLNILNIALNINIVICK